MSSSILLGRGPQGDVRLDVDLLLRSGLLLQANSGGGKSWALRRLAEQLCPIVPTFIIDPEGEFATLREHFPFVLVRREDGDVTADVSTAGPLAHKLLELGVSAVLDLYDLPIPERHAWVTAFLEAMDQAPKSLWRDVAVLIDEAHVYAPEKGKGESVALAAMAALASRGRKRGWGPIMATQRVAKFNKDVSSELKNLLVGLTWIANDRARAREDLGVDRAERQDIDNQLRFFKPGNFFALGRIFGSTDRLNLHVGPVVSSHPDPDARKRLIQPPPPPAKIRAILAKLSDLPAQPARAATSPATIGAVLKAAPARIERFPFIPPRISDDLASLDIQVRAALTQVQALRDANHQLSTATTSTEGELLATQSRILALQQFTRQFSADASAYPPDLKTDAARIAAPSSPRAPRRAPAAAARSNGVPSPSAGPEANGEGAATLTRGAREILAVLRAAYPTPLSKGRIANLCIMEPKGSTLRTYLGHLKTARFVTAIEDDTFALTTAGERAAGAAAPLPAARALIDRWQKKLTGKAKDMLLVFAEEGRALTKAEIGERLRLEPNGHTFRTYLGHLQTAGVVRKTSGGFVVAADLAIT